MSQSFTGLTCRDACASKYGVLQVTLRHIAWYWMTCTYSVLWYSILQFGQILRFLQSQEKSWSGMNSIGKETWY